MPADNQSAILCTTVVQLYGQKILIKVYRNHNLVKGRQTGQTTWAHVDKVKVGFIMASGYACNFLSEPADILKCLICLSVARDPRQHEECGKLFCSECIEKYGTDKPCPNCKQTGTQFYKDNRGRLVSDNLVRQ